MLEVSSCPIAYKRFTCSEKLPTPVVFLHRYVMKSRMDVLMDLFPIRQKENESLHDFVKLKRVKHYRIYIILYRT